MKEFVWEAVGRKGGGGLAERNYCLAETDTPTSYSQVMKERNKNFMNVSEVQVFIAGLRLSGMLTMETSRVVSACLGS